MSLMQTKVVNVKVANIRPIGFRDLESWCENPNHVYVGRKGVVFVARGDQKYRYPKKDSIWANPFKIPKTSNGVNAALARTQVIQQYREYIMARLDDPDDEEITYEKLEELRGKKLGCWCYPEGCHADVLVGLLE